MSRYCLTILLILLQSVMNCEAQSIELPGYTATAIGAKDGLPSSEILALHQDQKGFIWTGTSAGVSRYDGYRFKNFRGSHQQLTGNVHSIAENKRSNILWFATDNGLYYFKNEIFYKLNFLNEKEFLPFFDCFLTDDETLLLATAMGPAILSKNILTTAEQGTPFSFETFIPAAWKNLAYSPDKSIRNITGLNQQQIAFSSRNYLYRFQQQTLQLIDSIEIGPGYISKLHLTKKGVLAYTDGLKGLYTHDGISKSDFSYPKIANAYGGFDMQPTADGFELYSAIHVFYYNQTKPGLRPLVSTKKLNIKWPTRMIHDREDNYWLGSHEGLYLLKKNKFTFLNDPVSADVNEVYAMLQTSTNELLFGTNRGKVFSKTYNGVTQKFAGKPVVPRSEVFDIYEDEAQHLWFATGYEGISVAVNNHIIQLQKKDGFRDNTNFSFLRTSNKELWVTGENGISKLNYHPKEGFDFENYTVKDTGNFTVRFYNAIEGPDQSLWLASNKGLYHFKDEKLLQYPIEIEGFTQMYAWRIAKDVAGSVFIASNDHGIIQAYFDRNHLLKIRKTYSIKDGLNSQTFLDVALDDQQQLWASSYKGISCLQFTATETLIKNFDASDGFLKNNFQNLYLYKAPTGTMWAYGSAGVLSFDPSISKTSNKGFPLYITHAELLNSKKNILAFSEGRDSLGLPAKLRLPYHLNSIAIHFTALHFTNPSAVRYFYQLSGKDSSWIEIIDSRSISFRQLQPGDYEIKLKATIGGNEWSKIASFQFIITPPFWMQTWFLLLILVATCAFIYWLVKRREKNIKLKETQKTELEKIKTTSYQHQLETEQVINYFANSMNRQSTPEDMLWDLTKNCISKLGFEDCVIYLLEPQKNVLQQKAAWGPKTTEENKIIDPIEIPLGKGIVGSVAQTGKSEIVNDTSIDPRYIVDDQQRLSELTVPMLQEGKVIGIIDCEHSEKKFYTQRHLQILETVATICADRLQKMKAEAESYQKEMELVELNKNLATSQLTALRAQMNPHFIFNALNSIQQYVLTGDVDQANKYLSKFSRLQREVLHHCDQQVISVEKEIEMLQLYLEIEQLRFQDNFKFEIVCDEEIDPNEIKIPPMILQPFIENAIWHGLMNKSGTKKVSLHFQLPSHNELLCIITDNGIGRLAAQRLKQNNADTGTHKSKGLGLVIDRLKMLEQQYQQPFKVNIEDIVAPDGSVEGTRVAVQLYIE